MTRLRIFRSEDFLHTPETWPRNVGLAFVKKGDDLIGIEPCHRTEEPREIVFRIANLLKLDFPTIHVSPQVDGWPHEAITEENDRQFSAELGLILNHDSDLVEKAEDFGINFEFARERGLALAEVLPGADGPDPGWRPKFPPGFVSLAQQEPRGLIENVSIEMGENDISLIISDQGVAVRPKPEEIAIGADGRQVALPADVLVREEGIARLILPIEVFSAHGRVGEYHRPVITLHSDWMFICLEGRDGSCLLEESATSADEDPREIEEPVMGSGKTGIRKAFRRVAALTLIAMLLMAGAAAVIAQDEILSRMRTALQEDQDPIESIRNDMFR